MNNIQLQNPIPLAYSPVSLDTFDPSASIWTTEFIIVFLLLMYFIFCSISTAIFLFVSTIKIEDNDKVVSWWSIFIPFFSFALYKEKQQKNISI